MSKRSRCCIALLLAIAARPLAAQISAQPAARRDDGLAVGVTQTATVTATARSYRVGDTQVNERTVPFSWRVTSPRFVLSASGEPLRVDAPAGTLSAWSPVRARADVLLRVGDTISVYGRSGSSPVTLDPLAIRVVGAVGTSVLDLSSQSLGVPPQIGVRASFSFPLRDVVIGVSGAVEQDVRPSGTGAVYWQGTTVRSALSMNALFGERRLTLSADASYSRSDSLAGRNQFPGGGSAGVSADVSGPVDEAGRFWFTADAFYALPFGNARADQPTRLIPSGDFAGASAALLAQLGALTWSPSVTLLRESSRASVLVQQGAQRARTTLIGSAWSVAGGLSVDIPLGRTLTLSPEAGMVAGTVSSTLQQTMGRIVGRRGRSIGTTTTDGFRDPVRGWWTGVELRARF